MTSRTKLEMNNIPLRLVLKYYWEAKTIFSAHSPFIYQFMKAVMNDRSNCGVCNQIESKRKDLLRSKESISFVEYGAGSSIGGNDLERKVADVARHSLSGKWQCRLIHNIAKHYDLINILEIGTSLGVSTAYLASSNPNTKVITLEGNPSSAQIALTLFGKLKLDAIDLKLGEFGDTLDAAVEEMETIDLAFLDGNHRKRATLDYFRILKQKANDKSVFVVDDIYWSKEMNEAWNDIIRDNSVAFSIDLFRMGIVFFDHTIMPKQHFKLIPYKLKPWSIGLFG